MAFVCLSVPLPFHVSFLKAFQLTQSPETFERFSKNICQMVINLRINFSDSRSMSQLKVVKFNLYNQIRYISSAPLLKIFIKRLSHAHLSETVCRVHDFTLSVTCTSHIYCIFVRLSNTPIPHRPRIARISTN